MRDVTGAVAQGRDFFDRVGELRRFGVIRRRIICCCLRRSG